MSDVRRAPVQGAGWQSREAMRRPPGTISWTEHLEAYEAYAARYGRDQSAERLAERGGFGWTELVLFLGHEPRTWQPRSNP